MIDLTCRQVRTSLVGNVVAIRGFLTQFNLEFCLLDLLFITQSGVFLRLESFITLRSCRLRIDSFFAAIESTTAYPRFGIQEYIRG